MSLKLQLWFPALFCSLFFLWAGQASAVPTAPSGLVVSATTLSDGTYRGFRLNWVDNSSNENLFEITAKIGTSAAAIVAYPAANLTQNVFGIKQTAVPAGTSIVFTIYACRGTVSSAGVVSVSERSTGAATSFSVTNEGTPETGALNDPTDFSVTSSVDGKLTFSFYDASNKEDGYEILQADITGGAAEVFVGPTTPNYPASLTSPFKGVELPFCNIPPAVAVGATRVHNTFTLQSTLVPGHTYKFQIRAFTGPRNDTRKYSNLVGANAAVTIVGLAAPTGLTAVVTPENTVLLHWTDNSNTEQGYIIQAGIGATEAAATFADYEVTGANATTVTLTGVVPGVTYQWKVFAGYLPSGSSTRVLSVASNVVAGTTTFNKPTNFVATATGDTTTGETTVHATWTDNSNAETAYQFFYREVGDTDFISAGFVAANSTAANLGGLPKGLNVELIVRAYFESSEGSITSADSNIQTLTTKPGITSRAYEPITKGTAFSFAITTNEPSGWSRTDLTIDGIPAGLALNSGTGILAGTPTESGVFECTITATFTDGTESWVDYDTLTLRVVVPAASPTTPNLITAVTVPLTTNSSSLSDLATDVFIPLSELFADEDSESAVRVETSLGGFNIILQPTLTPETVKNFMEYADAHDYDGTVFHRAPTGFVLQGGGFRPVQAPDVFAEVPKRPSPINEPGITNAMGTVALAKQAGDPNSGTHDFFISLADNNSASADSLENQNGGFTVFGRVPSAGITKVNEIAAKPQASYTINLQGAGTSFTRTSLTNWPMNAAVAPSTMDTTKTLKIISVTPTATLIPTVVSNSNAGVLSAQWINGRLRLRGLTVGTSTLVVRATDLDGLTNDQTMVVTVDASFILPTIMQHPQEKTVSDGAAASFSVTAAGTSLSYQWLKDGAPIATATSATYSIAATSLDDAGVYTVEVSNAGTKVTSLGARLIVTQAPVITVDPVSQTKDYGSIVTFSVTATGSGPLNYQWYEGSEAIPGEVGSSLVLRSEANADFKVIVTNAAGSDESATAALTVTTTNDTDGDGLSDKDEDRYGTSSTVVDSDGDGYPDGLEVANGSNPALKASMPSKQLFVAAVSGDATEKAMRFKAVPGGHFTPAGGGSDTVISTQWASVYEMSNKEFASLLQYALVNYKDTIDALSIDVQGSSYRVLFHSKTLCYLAKTTAGAANPDGCDVDLFNGLGAPTTLGAVASFTVTTAKANLPVSGVTWYAAFFASHVLNSIHGHTLKSTPSSWSFNAAENGYFIPETQDWEWAARGGYSAAPYGTGMSISRTTANCDNPTTGSVKKVGSYKANSLGLYDLSGNVAEWVFNVDSGNSTHRYQRGGGWDSLIAVPAGYSPLLTDVRASVSVADDTRSASAGIRLFLRFDRAYILPATDVPTGPVITTQPAPKFLVTGETLSLNVVATGPHLLTYQWLKNNVAIKGQTSATLTIANTKLSHAGSYRVRITSLGESLLSSAVNVTLAQVPSTPEVRFVSAGSIISLSVPTAGPGLTYQWKYNDGANMLNDYYLNDVTAQTLKFGPLSLDRDSGGYICAITSVSPARTVLAGFNIVVQESPVVGNNVGTTTTPIWAITMPSNAIVGGSFTFAIPYLQLFNRVPTSFSVKGLPLGLTCNSKTGVISGKPRQSGPFKLSISASNAAGSYNTVVTTLTVAALPAGIEGAYVAAIPDDSRVGSIFGLSNDLGGRLDLTVNKNGTFTGRVTLASTSYPFASALDVAIGTGNNPTGVLLVNRKGKSSIAISFTLNASTNLLECYTAELNPFTGDLLASSQRFTGWRNVYTPSSQAGNYMGAHSFALDIPDTDQNRLWIPQGTGYGTLNITNLGKTTVAGKLGDGTAIATSAPLGPKGETLIYSSLYKASGTAIGTLTVGRDSLHTITLGDQFLFWLKRNQPITSKDRLYPNGFVIPLSVSGGLYLAPSSSLPVVMGITAGTGNAQLSFVGEDFDTGFSQLCNISATNVVTFPSFTEPRLTALTLKLTPSTGAFTGGLTLTDGTTQRALKYAGQIVQHPGFLGKGIGYGTYLIPALPGTGETLKTTPISSRQVVLEPTP